MYLVIIVPFCLAFIRAVARFVASFVLCVVLLVLAVFFVSLRVSCCDVLAVFRCGFVSCVVSLYSCRVCVSFVLCLIALRAVSACCWAIRYWSCRVSCR